MRLQLVLSLAAAAALSVVRGEVYFHETFDDDDWSSRWMQSKWTPPKQMGKDIHIKGKMGEFLHVTGRDFANATDKAISTNGTDAFFAVSAKLSKPLNNKNKDVYLSYISQYEQDIRCGGGFLKLLPSKTKQKNFNVHDKFLFMFGPDVCGMMERIHATFGKTEKREYRAYGPIESTKLPIVDRNAHVYSFILRQNNTYEIRFDGKTIQSGDLLDNWKLAPAKMIYDESKVRPADWPLEWIPDPDAKPPVEEDVEGASSTSGEETEEEETTSSTEGEEETTTEEGEEEEDDDDDDEEEEEPWQAPYIKNPLYTEWQQPKKLNPRYKENPELYNLLDDIEYIGFELFQRQSGSVFDDILLTDEADRFEEHEAAAVAKVTAASAQYAIQRKAEELVLEAFKLNDKATVARALLLQGMKQKHDEEEEKARIEREAFLKQEAEEEAAEKAAQEAKEKAEKKTEEPVAAKDEL